MNIKPGIIIYATGAPWLVVQVVKALTGDCDNQFDVRDDANDTDRWGGWNPPRER